MTRPTMDSLRRAANWVVYVVALLFLAGAVLSIWLGDWRYIGIAGALVVTVAVVVALTEQAEAGKQ